VRLGADLAGRGRDRSDWIFTKSPSRRGMMSRCRYAGGL